MTTNASQSSPKSSKKTAPSRSRSSGGTPDGTRDGDRLEASIAEILSDPQHDGHPARDALATLYGRYQGHLAQLERLMSIADRYHSAVRARNETTEERYRKQLRHLQKIIRISDRYQEMLRDAFLALGESESRFRSLVVASSQRIWQSDGEGRIASGGGEGELAADPRHPVGRTTSWIDEVHPGDRPRVEMEWAAALEGAKPFHSEFRMLTGEGSERDYAARAVPVLQEDGSVREWIGTLTDVTEQRRAEAARAEQLLIADRLEQFRVVATSLAHEINNPMAIILGTVQLLGRSRDLSPVDRARLETIGEAAQRVGELVIGLRDLEGLVVTTERGIARLRIGARETPEHD